MRGFARVSAAVPACGVADFAENRANTLALWRQADAEGSALVVFPELGLSAYSVRDLFFDRRLLEACRESLVALAEQGRELAPLALVGLPLVVGAGIYNVAAAISGGRVVGLVPKAYLPSYREFEEARWFRPGTEVAQGATVGLSGAEVPFGTDLLFEADGASPLAVGVEICEDLWVQQPPSARLVSAGANVICNLSASNFTIGKAELRRLLACSAADRGKCAYIYVAAGPGESSTDLAFDADAFIVENGRELSSSVRFSRDNQLLTVDVDLEALLHERLVTGTFSDCARELLASGPAFRRVRFGAPADVSRPLRREVSPHPFLPKDPATLATRCWEIFEIQTNALATRIKAAGIDRLVLGVSGGLDSTHAALVSAVALDLLGLPRSSLDCVTMPGLGTSRTTRGNAELLTEALGARFREVSVSEMSRVVLAAVAHPAAGGDGDDATVEALVQRLRADPALADTTVENVQARLRTLLLMTLANQHDGLVVGTGDLSEKALGWATYAGDQISMYDVNASVPKTLIQFVIRWVANERLESWSAGDPARLREVLLSILDTPISPELLPVDSNGEIAQLTEEAIGPYELHDFFLYHFVRHGARPTRILELAGEAFGERYPVEELKRWLSLFFRRFFANQFKRSCTADGPKVGMVALSPRGDWRMPSDAQVAAWVEEVERFGEA